MLGTSPGFPAAHLGGLASTRISSSAAPAGPGPGHAGPTLPPPLPTYPLPPLPNLHGAPRTELHSWPSLSPGPGSRAHASTSRLPVERGCAQSKAWHLRKWYFDKCWDVVNSQVTVRGQKDDNFDLITSLLLCPGNCRTSLLRGSQMARPRAPAAVLSQLLPAALETRCLVLLRSGVRGGPANASQYLRNEIRQEASLIWLTCCTAHISSN